MDNVPIHLRSTVVLLKKSFPTGLEENEYLAVIQLLYDYMSDRNLAEVLAFVTGKPYESCYNDICGVCHRTLEASVYEFTKNKLYENGYADWMELD